MSFDSVFYADFEYQRILFVNRNPTRKNDGHFSKILFFWFLTTFVYFEFFDPKKVFKKNKEHLFVISSNSSIEWCIKKSKISFMESLLTVHLTKNPCWVSGSPISGKPHSPPTVLVCFDRSFVALSNVMSHYPQSSLVMEFLGLENSAIKKVSRDPSPSDGSKNFLNISILIALMMRNPNLSSEFL